MATAFQWQEVRAAMSSFGSQGSFAVKGEFRNA